MNENCVTIYARYRKAAGITQERAAELLGVAVRTLAGWERGESYPPDMRVLSMADIYCAPTLAIEHLRLTAAIARDIIPEVPCVPLPQAVCSLVASIRMFENQHREDCLLRLAADGQIDQMEAAEFAQIVDELEDVIAAALALRYAKGGVRAWT